MRSSPSSSRPPPEVWIGKGLVSWALSEPELKNLITGRICRRAEFTTVTAVPEGMSALEALMAAHNAPGDEDGKAWGIEISLGLKCGMAGGMTFPLPLHAAVESGYAAAQAGFLQPVLRPSPPHHQHTPGQPRRPLVEQGPLQRAPSIGIPRITTPARSASSQHAPSSASSTGRTPVAPAPQPRGVTRKRESERIMSSVDMNRPQPSSTPARPDSGLVLPKPEDMTKEQAKELLKNGTFLQMLEQITGAPLTSMAVAKEAEEEEQPVTKRARFDTKEAAAELKCSNCSTTRSSVWRTKKSENGEENVRVCNACGLWFNKTRTMRPKEFWTNPDEEPVRRGRASKAKKEATAKATQERGLKRTLTQVVEKDARRIADMRKATPKPAPTRRVAAKPVPMTSPSTSAPKAVRNAKFAASTAIAASSPGGWAQPLHPPAPSTPAPANTTPVAVKQESPSSAVRRILAAQMPNLTMPLSDDAPAATPTAVSWNPDISAFFDVGGFAMPPNQNNNDSHHVSPVIKSEVNGVSSVVRNLDSNSEANPPATSDDDVFSQLFQRTSSMGQFDGSSHASSHASTPFDFSQLPPSSPPALPSNLPHSALLLSSPGGSPLDYSPRADSDAGGKVSPARSGLRNEIAKGGDTADGDAVFHELLAKLESSPESDGHMNNEELLALFNSLPAASAA